MRETAYWHQTESTSVVVEHDTPSPSSLVIGAEKIRPADDFHFPGRG